MLPAKRSAPASSIAPPMSAPRARLVSSSPNALLAVTNWSCRVSDDAGARDAAEQDDLVRGGAQIEQTRLELSPCRSVAACLGVPDDDRYGHLLARYETLAILECAWVRRLRRIPGGVAILDRGPRSCGRGGLVGGGHGWSGAVTMSV